MNRIAETSGDRNSGKGNGNGHAPEPAAVSIPVSIPIKTIGEQKPVVFGRLRLRKRTKEVEKQLLAAIRKGHTRRDMAKLAGVSYQMFYDWLASDAKFAAAVERAEAQYAGRLVKIIDKASRKTWQAAAWILERRFADQWGRHLITEPPKPPGAVDVGELSEDEQIKRLRGVFGMANPGN